MAFTCAQMAYCALMGILMMLISFATNGTAWQKTEETMDNPLNNLGSGKDSLLGDLMKVLPKQPSKLTVKQEIGLATMKDCVGGECRSRRKELHDMKGYEKMTAGSFSLASLLTFVGWIWAIVLGCCACCKMRQPLWIIAAFACAALFFGVIFYAVKKDYKLGWTFYVGAVCAVLMIPAVIAGWMARKQPPNPIFPTHHPHGPAGPPIYPQQSYYGHPHPQQMHYPPQNQYHQMSGYPPPHSMGPPQPPPPPPPPYNPKMVPSKF